jgi:hypothetical protein
MSKAVRSLPSPRTPQNPQIDPKWASRKQFMAPPDAQIRPPTSYVQDPVRGMLRFHDRCHSVEDSTHDLAPVISYDSR